MATFRYITRASTKSLEKLCPIYVRMSQGSVDLKVKTGLRVRQEHWNNATGTIRNKADFNNKDEFAKTLRDLKNFILDKLATYPGIISKEWIEQTINEYYNPVPKIEEADLFSFVQNFIEKAPVRITPKTGRPASYKQIREYERTFYYLKAYAKYKKIVLDFEGIDLDFYYEFVAFLQKLKLAQNTIGKKVQTLKIFLNAANDAGLPVNSAFKSHRFTAISEESESIYLTEEELEKIYQLDLSDRPALDRVRDLFIVGCWTGLRFSDWNQIRSDNISDGFLELKQQKTGGAVVIPLHPTVIQIFEKYSGFLPPVLTNQKFNEALKILAKNAELTETVHKSITKGGIRTSKAYPKHDLVTTHTARRSFATNLYKAGLPTYSIMQVTGHKTEVSFLKYIKVTPREHAEKLKQFWFERTKLKVV